MKINQVERAKPVHQYHRDYAKRHHDLMLGAYDIAQSKILSEAAELEGMLLAGIFGKDMIEGLYKARMQFQDKFPQTKGIHCRCKKVWIDGWYKTRCNMVCRLSVLSLIRKEDLFSDAIL